jgi:hypothetical protein
MQATTAATVRETHRPSAAGVVWLAGAGLVVAVVVVVVNFHLGSM